MELLVVDAEGRIVIPPEAIKRAGLHPGDEVPLHDGTDRLFLFIENPEARAAAQEWWNGMSEEDRRIAREEAEKYEALSEEERDAIWNEFDDSIEEEAEGDEIDLSTFQPAVR